MSVGINDNTTWRHPAISVNDGSVWRQVRGIYINDNGTWRPATRYTGMLTVGTDSTNYFGMHVGFGFGSRSPANMPPATTGNEIIVYDILYVFTADASTFQLRPVAEPSDLDSITKTNYVKYVTVNNITVATSTADEFTSAPSLAFWRWNGAGDQWGLEAANGTSVPVQITCVA